MSHFDNIKNSDSIFNGSTYPMTMPDKLTTSICALSFLLIMTTSLFPAPSLAASSLTTPQPTGFCKATAETQKEKSFWQRGLSTISSAFSWKHVSLGKFEQCQDSEHPNKKITFSVFYNASGLTGSAETLNGENKRDYFRNYKIKAMRETLEHALTTRSRYADRRYVTFAPKYMGSDGTSVFLMSSHKITSGKNTALQFEYCALTPFKDKIIHFCWAATAKDYSTIKSALTLAKLKQVNGLLENYIQDFLKANG